MMTKTEREALRKLLTDADYGIRLFGNDGRTLFLTPSTTRNLLEALDAAEIVEAMGWAANIQCNACPVKLECRSWMYDDGVPLCRDWKQLPKWVEELRKRDVK